MDDQQVLRSAVATGVMEVRPDGTNYCTVCDKALSEPAPHLKGKDHENHLVWYTLQHPSPPQELLNALPAEVRAAKLENEIELVDKALFSYKCLVCQKKNRCTGIEPLKGHLNGNDHKKVKKNMQAFSPTPSAQITQPPLHHSPQTLHQPSHHPQPVASISHYYGKQSTYAQQTPNPNILSSPFPGTQYNPSAQSRSPYVPSFQPQLSSHQHSSPYHLQGSAQPSLRAPQPPQPQMPSQTDYKTASMTPGSSNPPLSGIAQLPVQQVNTSMVSSAMQSDWLNREVLPPEVQRALQDCVVERSQGSSAYKCLVCDKHFTGNAPLLEHLRSDKHKKKVSQQSPPDLSTLSIATDGRDVNKIRLESTFIGVGKRDQTDGQWTFPWPVVSTTSPQMPSETVYRNLSIPRGFVLIFNYYFTGQGLHERKGAKRDSFNLKTLFKDMGYIVHLHEDKRKSETEELLKKEQDNQYLYHFDSLIVFVLSHGKDNLHFACSDLEWMSLDDVRYCFTDNSCPALKGKPKLFFANFCRGDIVEPHMQYDSLPVKQMAPKDMMTLHACIDKFRAPRDEERGAIFVQVLCEVLATHAHNSEMQDLVIRINRLTQERGGATPEFQGYDFKKFYFNPSQQ